jgi:hypothetical protein
MGKKKIDPTAPGEEITLQGRQYNLVFTYGALATAEQKLSTAGRKVSMFEIFDWQKVGASELQVMLFAALQHHHGELTFDEAVALLTLRNYAAVHAALVQAYVKSMADPDEKAAEESGN